MSSKVTKQVCVDYKCVLLSVVINCLLYTGKYIYCDFFAHTVRCQKQSVGKCESCVQHKYWMDVLYNLCMFWNTCIYIKHDCPTYTVLVTDVGMLEQAADPGLALQLLVICGDKNNTSVTCVRWDLVRFFKPLSAETPHIKHRPPLLLPCPSCREQ